MLFFGDNNDQKMMASNDTSVKVVIDDLISYKDLSFYIARKPRLRKVLDL